MTNGFDLVEEIGQSLYGGYWQKQLATALGISDRAFRVWRSGRSEVPVGSWEELAALLGERGGEMLRLASTVRRMAEELALTEEQE